MRDGITLTKAGHPAIVFVHDFFERAARTQAKALGLPDLRIYVYAQPKPGDATDIEPGKAVKAAAELQAMFGQQT